MTRDIIHERKVVTYLGGLLKRGMRKRAADGDRIDYIRRLLLCGATLVSKDCPDGPPENKKGYVEIHITLFVC
jgi:hypothetical protein